MPRSAPSGTVGPIDTPAAIRPPLALPPAAINRPRDLQLEAEVLSSCLMEPSFIPQVASITAGGSYFDSPAHRAIFNAMVRLLSEGLTVDEVTLASRFHSDPAARAALALFGAGVPDVARVIQYAGEIRSLATRREMVGAGERLALACETSEGPADIAARFIEELSEFNHPAGTSRLTPLSFAGAPKPSPRRSVLRGWIPEGFSTFLYGPGGVFKSWIALDLCLSICSEVPFHGIPTRGGGVLWLDWELDAEECTRRVRSLMLGRGLDPAEIPQNFRYLNLAQSIRDKHLQTDLRAIIQELAPRLVVMDSYTMAARGGDVISNDDIADVIAILRSFGCTVLVIDHTTKQAMADRQLDATPIGGVTKYTQARSAIVVGAAGGSIIWRHKKSNFGPLMDPIAFQFTFWKKDPADDEEEETVWIRRVATDDCELSDLEAQLPAEFRVLAALQREGPLSALEISERLDPMAIKTIKNTLTALKKRNKVIPGADGRWSVSGHGSLSPFTKGTGTGTRPQSRTESRTVPTSGLPDRDAEGCQVLTIENRVLVGRD
jgi:hypothetical protein